MIGHFEIVGNPNRRNTASIRCVREWLSATFLSAEAKVG